MNHPVENEETPDDEIFDLLTCHRSDPRPSWESFLKYVRIKLSDLSSQYRWFKRATGFKSLHWLTSLWQPNQDTDFPFPWTRNASPSSSSSERKRNHADAMEPTTMLDYTRKTVSKKNNQSPRLQALSAECQALGCISLNLYDHCDLNPVAGKFLRHAIQVLEKLFQKLDPLIFKVGYTHNPVWRWSNQTYGYALAREKWTDMIVLYYSKEPYSAAMLEAALIEKYMSSLETPSIYFLDLWLWLWILLPSNFKMNLCLKLCACSCVF